MPLMKNERLTLTNLVEIHKQNAAEQVLLSGAQLFRYDIPLSPPLSVKGLSLSQRSGVIVQLTFSDGSNGFGEVAPLPGFSSETLADCVQLLPPLLNTLIGRSANEYIKFIKHDCSAAIAFALDCAFAKIPCLQQRDNDMILTLLHGDPLTILAKYRQLKQVQPVTQVKLKVGRQNAAQDAKLIHQLLAENPELTFVLDANQTWSLANAKAFAALIPKDAIVYIEEPCQNAATSRRFATETGIAIGLDETLQDRNYHFSPDKTINAVIIKPTLVGSFSRCLSFIEQAKAARMYCYLSSSYESSLGISQLSYLAKHWTPGQACGLDTLAPLSHDILIDSGAGKPVLQLKQLECIWSC